jgi:hypothetical protein
MVDREHTLIVGDSGGGKTSLAREVFDKANGAVLWVNHNNESGLEGCTAKSLEGLKGCVEERGRKPNLILKRGSDMSDKGMAATAIRFARWYSRTYREGIKVFFDEAQHFLPEGEASKDTDSNPVAWAIHEGRDEGIAIVLISQTPRQLEYQPLYNAKWWVWCGPPAGMHGPFLSHNIASWIPEERLPSERFKYVVMDNRGNVVYEGRTLESYS